MFVGFSSKLRRMGKIRIGAGFHITKHNAWFGFLVLFFVYFAQLMWYMLIFGGWIFYYTFYGLYVFYRWCYRKIRGVITRELP